jgi:hypothetical protein
MEPTRGERGDRRESGRWRLADWLSILLLLLVCLAAYGQLLLPDRMLADYDALVYFMPLRAYAAAAVAEGRAPLWNPDSFLGAPFLANPQTAVLYPATWLFFVLAVPQAYGVNLVLHTFLAGVLFYLLLRIALASGPASGLVGATTFMLSGVLAGQYGHLNQLSAVAWLPGLLLVAWQGIGAGLRGQWAIGWSVLFGSVLMLQVLAGHPQQTFMSLVACGLLWICQVGRRVRSIDIALRSSLVLAVGVPLGLSLAAAQVLPTLELAQQSVRAGGLTYRDAVADSLWPWLAARALMPSYVNDLGSTELLGYIGVVPALLALIALGWLPWRRLVFPTVLGAVALALAFGGANPIYPLLYEYVPGIASFRVPARWLLLYTVAASMLAALGLEAALRWRRPWPHRPEWSGAIRAAVPVLVWVALYFSGARATRELQLVWIGLGLAGVALLAALRRLSSRRPALGVLTALVAGELLAAGGDLAPRFPVPIEAYAQPRDSTMFVQARVGRERMLSIASESYELKETPDYREWFQRLPERSLEAFLVASKRNEVLTPNLNLLYGLPSPDGYDGGLLPPRRWLELASLLVPKDRLRPDGVLISRLESLPQRPLLDLFAVRAVLTNRARDDQEEGVEYDRAVLVPLEPGRRLTLERVPHRAYTSLGLISWLEGPLRAPGTVVGRVVVTDPAGADRSVPLRAFEATAPGTGVAPESLPNGLEARHPWSWQAEGDGLEFLGRIALPTEPLGRLAIENTSPDQRLWVRALTLIDERDGATTSLVLDDRLERASFFEMKVYEYPDVPGRAYLVHRVVEADDQVALAALGSSQISPSERAFVPPGSGLSVLPATGEEVVQVLELSGETARIGVNASSPALLVLADAYDSGWQAWVDGRPTRMIRTNVGQRGVLVEAGEHVVEQRYEPSSFRFGVLASSLSAVLCVGLCCGTLLRRIRARA